MTNLEPAQLKDRFEFAALIARQAGELTLELFLSPELDVDRKSDGSPVTAADRGAEELLRKLIIERFPDDAILGEEFGEQDGTSGFRWVLDPIDGTKAFISGVPLYTTLVAVLHDDQPQIGVVFAPAAGEMVYAARGLGCWHTVGTVAPRQCSVSSVSDLAEAVFVTTSVKAFTTYRAPDGRPVYDRLQAACRVTRTWGDAFGYLLVATGRAEIMVDPEVNLWDIAALPPIIEEAGGKFMDWKGESTVHNREAIATNGLLAEAVLKSVREG